MTAFGPSPRGLEWPRLGRVADRQIKLKVAWRLMGRKRTVCLWRGDCGEQPSVHILLSSPEVFSADWP